MNDFEHLPEDLQDIARALAAHRDVPDGHLLERVLSRVKAAPRPRRGFAGFFRARLAALSMLALILGLNVTGALASVLQSFGLSSGAANSIDLSNLINSLTQTVSTGSNWQSAADEVYCDEHGKSGSDDNAQGGSEQNNGTWSSPTTNGTKSDSEKNGGTEENSGGGSGGDQCKCPQGSGSGGQPSGGSEKNMSPVSNVATSPTTTSGSGKSKVTTYTTTTTTTTPMPDMGSGMDQCGCPTGGGSGSGSEQNGGSEKVDTKVDTYTNGSLTKTTTGTTYKSSDSGSENNGGGSGGGQCCPTGSGSGGQPSGGSEKNMSPVSNVVTSPTTTSGSGKSKVTTYTTTTTTTTPQTDYGSTSGGSCGHCPPSGQTGSEQNGGSEKVDTKVDTYTNGSITKTTTGTTYKSSDSGSETNSGSCPEKPGCGNEQQAGQSGASGVHGGQPADNKSEERGSCPHQTGVEGLPATDG